MRFILLIVYQYLVSFCSVYVHITVVYTLTFCWTFRWFPGFWQLQIKSQVFVQTYVFISLILIWIFLITSKIILSSFIAYLGILSVNCLLVSSPYFSVGYLYFFLSLICKSSLYSLNIRSLSIIGFLKFVYNAFCHMEI